MTSSLLPLELIKQIGKTVIVVVRGLVIARHRLSLELEMNTVAVGVNVFVNDDIKEA